MGLHMAMSPFFLLLLAVCDMGDAGHSSEVRSSIVLVIGTIIQAASQTFAMLVVARFIVGIGTGVLAVVSLLLLAEVSYPSHRAVITAMSSIFWPVGAAIAAGVTYGPFQMPSTWGWRIPSLLQGAIPLVQIVLVFFTPESPRWLVDQGRREEAEQILIKYHGFGDPNSPLVQYELLEIYAAIETEKLNQTSKWKQWISSSGNLYRLALIIFLGFVRQLQGNSLVSYYLTLVLESIGIESSKNTLIINICLQIWSVFMAAAFSVTVEKYGRRRQLLISLATMFVAFLLWTICSAKTEQGNYQNKGLSAAVLLMIFIFQAGSHFFAPAVYALATEIPQYSLRSKAGMIFALAQNLASIFSGYVNPCVVYLYLPETGNMSLEEVAGIFDGDNALVSWKGVRKIGKRERKENAARYVENAVKQVKAAQKEDIEHEHVECVTK